MKPLLAFLLAVVPPGSVALRRSPKVGDHAIYALRALIDLGGKDDIRFEGSLNETVKRIDGETIATAIESRVSVDALGIVRQGGTLSSTREERLDGTLLAAAKIDPTLLFAGPRVDRLRTLYLPKVPVEAGASWWHTEGKDEVLKSPPFSSFQRLEGAEKIGDRDAWRLSVEANEADDANPVHVKGMVWIDKSDGSLVRGQWTIDGFVYDAKTPAMHARLELVRTGS